MAFRGNACLSGFVGAALSAIAIPAWPAELYIGPSAYYAFPDSHLHAKADVGAQLALGYLFAPQWSIEGLSEIGRFDFKDGNGTLNERGLSVQGVYRIPIEDEPMTPFVTVGGGWLHTSYQGTSDDVPLVRAGVGLNFILPAPAWSIRADAAVRHLFGNSAAPFYATHNQNDVILSAGIQYSFRIGGDQSTNSSATSQIPPAEGKTTGIVAVPPSSTANSSGRCIPGQGGCAATAPDQDGDGVPDSLDKCPDTPPSAVVDADGCVLYLRGGAAH